MPPDPAAVSASVFAALADPTRRAILASLAEHGPSTATDLSGRLAITRQGVAKHLGLLGEVHLVISDAGSGRRVLHRHRSEPIKVAQSYLAALAADWDDSLDRLSSSATTTPCCASASMALRECCHASATARPSALAPAPQEHTASQPRCADDRPHLIPAVTAEPRPLR